MRTTQREAIAEVGDRARLGGNAVFVAREEPGSGRVLDQVAGAAAGFRVERVTATPGLAYSGLHTLCARLDHHVDQLSGAQRDVLRTACDPIAPDLEPALVAVALFGLLARAAAWQPLCCVFRRLDEPSSQALALTARRLTHEPIVLLFVVSGSAPAPEFRGLPEIRPASPSEPDPEPGGCHAHSDRC